MGNVAEKSRIITVEVTDSRPSGIRVILPDGRKGFIRPREISWERRISIPNKLPKKGDVLEAVIMPDESRGDLLFLSLRQCTDPWSEAILKQKYKVGQIVVGEVVNVRNTGIYIQVEPGIDGVIFPKDVPMIRGRNSIEETILLGDKVSVVIDGIDRNKHLLELNLVKRLQKLPVEVEERKQHLLGYFGVDQHPRFFGSPAVNVDLDQPVIKKRFVRPSIRRLERILIVENEMEWLDFISEGLEKEFGVKVDMVENGNQALAHIRAGTKYSLVILDYHLKDELGTSVADKISKEKPYIPLLLMSAYELDEDGRPLDANGYSFCYKSLDDLIQRIEELRSGYWHISHKMQTMDKEENFIRQLGMQALSRRNSTEIFADILKRLHEQTGVAYCILLELDRKKQAGSIIAAYPPMNHQELRFAEDGLYYSPARQVVEEEREMYENIIDLEADSRFKNFFSTIDFQSFLGIPISIPDQATRYALFLLDEETLGFSEREKEGKQRFNYARTTGHFLTVAIEQIELMDYMRRYEEKYSLGHLASLLIHEMNNKMGAFRTSVKNFKESYGSIPKNPDPQLMHEWRAKMDLEVQRISEIQENLSRLVQSYARQAEGKYESVDVNKVVEDVALELGRTAERKTTEIVLDLSVGLPEAWAIRSQLQQIVLNVALNAIQMINLQCEFGRMLEQHSKHYIPALQKGTVVIQTRYAGDEMAFPIEVRLIDNGPGVHWRDQERIFFAGITRRGGAGLGLYISRNLIERMGGKLNILDSSLFIGSAFSLELRSYSAFKEQK